MPQIKQNAFFGRRMLGWSSVFGHSCKKNTAVNRRRVATLTNPKSRCLKVAGVGHMNNTIEPQRPSRMAWFLLGALVGGAVCLYIGSASGQRELSGLIYEDQADAGKKIIGSNSDYSDIIMVPRWKGDVMFVGTVPTPQAYSKLEAAIIEQFGRLNLDDRMSSVKIKG
jgi:hypothetical protein